jgi:hypothetical protein
VTLIKPEGEAFLVLINKETGEVCAQYQNKKGCAATGRAKRHPTTQNRQQLQRDPGYYCGALCAGSIIAVMSHNANGWHIVSKTTQWLS